MQTWVAFYVFIHPFTNYLSVSWGIDESTHQIPSNGLLFLTFYHFPYTPDPLTSTTPTWPSPTFSNHCVITTDYTLYLIAPSPRYHIGDLPYDLWTTLLYFPFLVSSLLPDASFCSPTDHKSSHCMVRTLPYVSPHTNLVFVLLIVCI